MLRIELAGFFIIIVIHRMRSATTTLLIRYSIWTPGLSHLYPRPCPCRNCPGVSHWAVQRTQAEFYGMADLLGGLSSTQSKAPKSGTHNCIWHMANGVRALIFDVLGGRKESVVARCSAHGPPGVFPWRRGGGVSVKLRCLNFFAGTAGNSETPNPPLSPQDCAM